MKELKPNFTQIPNVVLDKLLHVLEKGELKVFLYIARRTYGFQKDSDRIAFSQLLKGIKSKDGEQLDYGTGIGRETLTRSIKSLEEKYKLIKVHRTKGTNEYSINLNYTSTIVELVPQSNQSSTIVEPKVVPQSNTQKKEKESNQNKEEIKLLFDEIRTKHKKLLKGKARGLETEWKDFIRKHPKADTSLLEEMKLGAARYYKAEFNKDEAFKYTPNFKTWYNQSRWEEYTQQ